MARTKSDARRQAIIEAASALFRAKGYERTTMADINAEVGGSKATLYSYFASKEELLLACVFEFARSDLDQLMAGLDQDAAPLAVTLTAFAEKLLALVVSPEVISARRLAIAEAGRSGIGQLFYEGVSAHQAELARFFAEAMDDGRLRADDPLLAARQFRALLGAEVMDACLLSAVSLPLAEPVVREAAGRAVAAFLRAYAPAPG